MNHKNLSFPVLLCGNTPASIKIFIEPTKKKGSDRSSHDVTDLWVGTLGIFLGGAPTYLVKTTTECISLPGLGPSENKKRQQNKKILNLLLVVNTRPAVFQK